MKHFILGENDKDTIRRLRQQNEYLKYQLEASLNSQRKDQFYRFFLNGRHDLSADFREYLKKLNLTINDVI